MHSHMERPWPGIDLLLVWQKCKSSTLSGMSIRFLLTAAGLGKRVPRTDHQFSTVHAYHPHTHSKQPSVFGLWEETGVPRQKNPQRQRENIQTAHGKAGAGIDDRCLPPDNCASLN